MLFNCINDLYCMIKIGVFFFVWMEKVKWIPPAHTPSFIQLVKVIQKLFSILKKDRKNFK